MRTVIFDVRGTVAHFRRPDTTATQLTYPFITPTAAKGMVGAILGLEDFTTSDRVGIQLLHPVQTTTQQLSMLGKDAGPSFNRPTTIELLVNPAYRIYYTGNEFVNQLAEKLYQGQSVYPTYLGVAYALTFPKMVDFEENVSLVSENRIRTVTKTVVPVDMIKDLIVRDNQYLSRANGFLKKYKGNRTFEQSLSFLYERDGKDIEFNLNKEENEECLAKIGDEYVCLI